MSFARVERHKTKAVELRQQWDILYMLKDQPGSHARGGVSNRTAPVRRRSRGGLWMRGAPFNHVVKNCAQPYDLANKMLDWPAILGIALDRLGSADSRSISHMITGGANPYLAEFAFIAALKPSGVGFRRLDHVTHNVFKGKMDRWFDFYSRVFNFCQTRFSTSKGNTLALTATL
jgi:4-hydroxyphenylpyruvate dioxygenase